VDGGVGSSSECVCSNVQAGRVSRMLPSNHEVNGSAAKRGVQYATTHTLEPLGNTTYMLTNGKTNAHCILRLA
jgi:hypothetical protein